MAAAQASLAEALVQEENAFLPPVMPQPGWPRLQPFALDACRAASLSLPAAFSCSDASRAKHVHQWLQTHLQRLTKLVSALSVHSCLHKVKH